MHQGNLPWGDIPARGVSLVIIESGKPELTASWLYMYVFVKRTLFSVKSWEETKDLDLYGQ